MTEALPQINSEIGQVESVQIITDRDTGRSKGFGFVQMADDAAARKPSKQTDADEECEFTDQPHGWAKPYRFLALRYDKAAREKKNDKNQMIRVGQLRVANSDAFPMNANDFSVNGPEHVTTTAVASFAMQSAQDKSKFENSSGCVNRYDRNRQ